MEDMFNAATRVRSVSRKRVRAMTQAKAETQGKVILPEEYWETA